MFEEGGRGERGGSERGERTPGAASLCDAEGAAIVVAG